MIKKQSFGKTPEGREVFTYALDNGCGVIPVVSDYGATLVKLFANDKDGDPVDVICGFDSVDGYIRASGYQGATVGRVCNRIGGAKFTLNGVDSLQTTANILSTAAGSDLTSVYGKSLKRPTATSRSFRSVISAPIWKRISREN